MILIFSEKNCHSTSEVVEWLRSFNEFVVRLNGDEERAWLKYIDIDRDEIILNSLDYGDINIAKAKSVWYRRNGISKSFFSASFDPHQFFGKVPEDSLVRYLNRSYISEINKIKDYIYGLSERISLSVSSYLNADLNKLEVLKYAKDLGLDIPRTIVANTDSEVTNLLYQRDTEKSIITKAINDGVYFFGKKNAYYSYTEKYDPESIKSTYFFSLFQYEVNKHFEIRSFYLKGEFYSMAIISQNNEQTKVDFRKYDSKRPNRTVPYNLPKLIKKKLMDLFIKLDLNSGSVDLIRDQDGRYIFLEINPVGQFGMVAYPCNYPIDKIMASTLCDKEYALSN
jgi:ATP-GRASP peptide maturase of grasp-with-spasm system